MYERSNKQKSKFDEKKIRQLFLLISFANIVVIFGFYTAFVLFSYIDVNSNFMNRYPTSIPSIDDQFQCEKTERTWRNNKCWDYQHDPSF
ncbi:hypothetical protein NIES2098_07950 [Calothrix sp. NIES-2098]|nr:hypothetical protein NIES2098_07950 [Calothrix sp. NIES-2098]